MLNTNAKCQILNVQGTDMYGQPTFGQPITERCAIVKLRRESKHTTVRADSSESRGHGDEFVSTNKVLLDGETAADIGDQLIVAGFKIRITTMQPRYDVFGEVDHFETTGELWAL